jgi:hypothetical protein
VVPKKKYSLLLCYHETCTSFVSPVTYQERDDEVAARVATVTATVGLPTSGACAGVATDVLCSMGTVDGTPKPIFDAAAAGIPDAAPDQLTISDALHAVSATVTMVATDIHQSTIVFAALSLCRCGRYNSHIYLPNQRRRLGGLAPLVPRIRGDAAATGEDGHRANHCAYESSN